MLTEEVDDVLTSQLRATYGFDAAESAVHNITLSFVGTDPAAPQPRWQLEQSAIGVSIVIYRIYYDDGWVCRLLFSRFVGSCRLGTSRTG